MDAPALDSNLQAPCLGSNAAVAQPALEQVCTQRAKLGTFCDFTFVDDSSGGHAAAGCQSHEDATWRSPAKNGGTPVASPVPHVAEAETTNCSELTLQSTATNWPAQLDVHARDGSRSPSVASDRSRAIAEGRAAAAEVAEADARAQLLEVEAHLAESQAARTHLQQQIEEWQKAVAEVRGGLRDLFGSHTALVEADIPTPAAAATALIAAAAQLQDLRGENSRLEHCMRDVESRAQNAEGMLLERTRECEALRSELAEVRWLLSQRDTSLACQRDAVPVATPVPARRELPLGAAAVEKECSPNSEDERHCQQSFRLPTHPVLGNQAVSSTATPFSSSPSSMSTAVPQREPRGLPPPLPSEPPPRSISPPSVAWPCRGEVRPQGAGVVSRLRPRPSAAVAPAPELVTRQISEDRLVSGCSSAHSSARQVQAVSIPIHEIATPCRGASPNHVLQELPTPCRSSSQRCRTASQSPVPAQASTNISISPQRVPLQTSTSAQQKPLQASSSPHRASLQPATSPVHLRSSSPLLPASVTNQFSLRTVAPSGIMRHASPTMASDIPKVPVMRQVSAASSLTDGTASPVVRQLSAMWNGGAASAAGAGGAPPDKLELALEELRQAKTAVAAPSTGTSP